MAIFPPRRPSSISKVVSFETPHSTRLYRGKADHWSGGVSTSGVCRPSSSEVTTSIQPSCVFFRSNPHSPKMLVFFFPAKFKKPEKQLGDAQKKDFHENPWAFQCRSSAVVSAVSEAKCSFKTSHDLLFCNPSLWPSLWPVGHGTGMYALSGCHAWHLPQPSRLRVFSEPPSLSLPTKLPLQVKV